MGSPRRRRSGPKRIQNGPIMDPKTDSKQTQNGHKTDPKQTHNGYKMYRKRIQNRTQTKRKWTKMNVKRTLSVPKNDPKWAQKPQNRPKKYPKLTKLDPQWTCNGPITVLIKTKHGPKTDQKRIQNGPKSPITDLV